MAPVSRIAFDVVLAPVNDEPMFDPVADLVLPENALTYVLEHYWYLSWCW